MFPYDGWYENLTAATCLGQNQMSAWGVRNASPGPDKVVCTRTSLHRNREND